MYKYKSKCRWNLLLYTDGDIKEIRPGELFTSNTLIESRFVELQVKEQKKKPIKSAKKGRPKKIISPSIFEEESNASSSTQS